MSLQDNKVFVSPRNQKITRLDTRVCTQTSFGTEATSPLQLIEAVLSQCDEEMPCRAWDEGSSFDDQVWQQAISALRNQDENHRSREMNDDESVLFQLIQKGIVDMSSFDKNLKGTGVWYSAVIGDRLWAMFERERTRNDRLESDLHRLSREFRILSGRYVHLTQVFNKFIGDVNKELGKASSRLNRYHVTLEKQLSKQMELDLADHKECIDDHAVMINFRKDSKVSKITCQKLHNPDTPAILPEVPSGSHSPSLYLTPPEENSQPIPVLLWHIPPGLLGPRVPSLVPVVQESVSQLIPITEAEEREIEDTLVGAWQAQGRAHDNAPHDSSTDLMSVLNQSFAALSIGQSSGATQVIGQVASPEARAYRLLSVMRVVTLMPNSNVHTHLVARGMGGEMQIIFPLGTDDFDALCSEQFDTYDVHGLYDEVIPHSTIRVDDATDKLGRDILESIAEDDGDPDWADK
ncbi:hypothetical protein BDM02DRAFT_3191794 [Thelephora ganbajun]|uniref:Uncharacterized protein n=1 Tax=Thelephora ganbajun TaxID=370292 RepID=A0ACB6Z112_THEGA|nr:hypothetical protein BDM02DRAFT_3191794 [Thelephora ganbajun]